jgi:hypothetical protein
MTTTTQTVYISVADTAKLVRKAIKAVYPTQKVSVRSRSYAGGASIDVTVPLNSTLTDTEIAEMKIIARQFQGANFDGMTDSMSYHDSFLDGQRVSFGADFIHVQRDWK